MKVFLNQITFQVFQYLYRFVEILVIKILKKNLFPCCQRRSSSREKFLPADSNKLKIFEDFSLMLNTFQIIQYVSRVFTNYKCRQRETKEHLLRV